uniref:Uncharacterized protein n=1 Tax=Knipowitschia caucasica TaxID=637954 RepID=A0AAV2LRZ9_KNICA
MHTGIIVSTLEPGREYGGQEGHRAGVLWGRQWKGWGGKGKGEEEEKQVLQSYRAGASKDSTTGRRWGHGDPAETLNRCVKLLSAFLLGDPNPKGHHCRLWSPNPPVM